MAGYKAFEGYDIGCQNWDFAESESKKRIQGMSADDMLQTGIVSYPSFWNKCSTAFWTALVSGLNRIGAKKTARNLVEKRTASNCLLDDLNMKRAVAMAELFAAAQDFRRKIKEKCGLVAPIPFEFYVAKVEKEFEGRDPFYDSADPADLVVKFRPEQTSS